MVASRTWGAGFVLLGALLLAGRGRADEPDLLGRRIVAIEFRCAAPIDREDLLRLIPMHVGDELRAEDIERTRWRLTQTQDFTDIAIDPESRGDGAAIVARLVRKPVINAIRFEGNDALSDDELGRGVRLNVGGTLTDALRDYAVRRLRERYVAQGFDAVRVEALVRPLDAGEVELTFRIDEGTPLRIGALNIEGDLPVAPDEVRRALPVKVGDRYVRAQQRVAQAAIVRVLRQRQYYDADVGSRWEVGEAKRGTLTFQVDAGSRFVIGLSGNHHFSDAHLLGLLDLPGRPIVTDGTWRELARRAQRAYQEAGYYLSRVDLRIEPGPPKVVRFDVSEGRAFRVGKIEFDGNRVLGARLLRAQMTTQPPRWIPWRRGVFLDDVFDEDLKRLWHFYRRQGFASAEIVDARRNVDAARGTISATVFIEEGPRTIVQRIEQAGIELLGGRMPDLQVQVGKPLDTDQLEADRRALVTAFGQAGYTRAEVTAEVSSAASGTDLAATVRFRATPGVLQRVGTIIVQNNLDTRARVILRELPFGPGDPLDPDALLRGQGQIYRLGLFRSVTVRPVEERAQEDRRDVAVSVSEKPAVTVQWGAGYNTRDGIRGFLEVGHDNLQGLARRLSLRGEFSIDPTALDSKAYLANVGFREPRLGTTRWAFRFNTLAQRSTRSVDQFNLERIAFIPAIERSLLPGLQTGLEAQAEQSQVFDVAPDVLAFNPRDEGRLRTLSVGPFLVYDGRDDAFVPHRGVFDSLRARYAPAELGSDVPFVKVVGQHSQYVPLAGDLTFVYAARGGWALALEGGDQVPIRERFFLGGRTTVRGFSEDQIGPQGSLGNPLGGDVVLNLNSELHFPLIFGLGGVVFVDGGGVYLQDRAISIHDFRRSTGTGLRYVTPVGPISLEYGFKIDRRSGESLGEVHFSIGTIF